MSSLPKPIRTYANGRFAVYASATASRRYRVFDAVRKCELGKYNTLKDASHAIGRALFFEAPPEMQDAVRGAQRRLENAREEQCKEIVRELQAQLHNIVSGK